VGDCSEFTPGDCVPICDHEEFNYKFEYNELIVVKFIGNSDDVYFKEGMHLMPASSYYILLKAHENKKLRAQLEAAWLVLGIVSPIDEFYLIGKAIQYGDKGLKAIRFSSVKLMTSSKKIKVVLKGKGKRLEEISEQSGTKIDDYVVFLENLVKAGDELVDASGNVIGKFTRGNNLEIIDDVVLHGGNNIGLSNSKTTTVTGVLDDVNTVAKRGINPDGTFNGITTANGAVNDGGINILRDPRWGQIKAKHKAILDSGDELGYWQAVTDEFWNVANKPWLDRAITRGDNIRFVSDPFLDEAIYVTKNNSFVLDVNRNKIKSIFGREVDYLQANGYNILPNGTAVKP